MLKEDNEQFISPNRNNVLKDNIKIYIEALLSLPKTLWVNFRTLPFRQALKLPILVSYKTKIVELHSNTITFAEPVKRFMVKIGFGGSEGIIERKSSLCLEKNSKIQFASGIVMSAGISIRNSGLIVIGHSFFCNRNCTIWANKEINIGQNVLFGWNITLRDCDGHLVTHNGAPKEYQKPIIINNHTWICSEASLLKGAEIGDNSVVGYGSVVTSKFQEPNILIAGFPAKKIQDGINWVHG